MNCRICKSKPGDYVCQVTGFRLCGMDCFKKGIAPFIQGQGDKRAREDDDEGDRVSPIIKINVGGTIFTTLRSTLTKYDDSILAILADPEKEMRFTTDENGLPFIDIDPEPFKMVLSWLRTGLRPVEYDSNEEKNYLATRKFLSQLRYLGLLEVFNEEVQNSVNNGKKVIYMVSTYSGDVFGPSDGRFFRHFGEWKGSKAKSYENAQKALQWLLNQDDSKLLAASSNTYVVQTIEPNV